MPLDPCYSAKILPTGIRPDAQPALSVRPLSPDSDGAALSAASGALPDPFEPADAEGVADMFGAGVPPDAAGGLTGGGGGAFLIDGGILNTGGGGGSGLLGSAGGGTAVDGPAAAAGAAAGALVVAKTGAATRAGDAATGINGTAWAETAAL